MNGWRLGQQLCFLVAHELVLVRMYFGCAPESRVPSHLNYPSLLRQLGLEHGKATKHQCDAKIAAVIGTQTKNSD